MIKIFLVILIVFFVFLMYASAKASKRSAMKRRELIDKIKNRER